MNKLRLYSFWRSSSAWRARTALLWKHLDHEIVPVDLAHPEGGEHLREAHLARNPAGQVPVLEVVDRGRVRHIGQSMAILGFLEDRYSAFALLPEDDYLRARARQLAELVNAGIQPLQNTSVLAYVRDSLGQDARAWARHWIRRGLVVFEHSTRDTRRRFCVGDAVSWADLCLVPQLYNARRHGVELDGLEPLLEIEARCAEFEAFQRAHPDAQADAPASR